VQQQNVSAIIRLALSHCHTA